MDISNIILLYDGDGSPESPPLVPLVGSVEALVPVVGFGEALVPVVGFGEASVTVKLVTRDVLVGQVGGIKQLQIKNNIIIIEEEVVPNLNKPDSNYAGIMAPVTQQPCIHYKISFSQWKPGVGKYS